MGFRLNVDPLGGLQLQPVKRAGCNDTPAGADGWAKQQTGFALKRTTQDYRILRPREGALFHHAQI